MVMRETLGKFSAQMTIVIVDETSIPVTPTPTVTWHETLLSLCHLATSCSHPVQGKERSVPEFCYSLGLEVTAVNGDFSDSVDFPIVALLQKVVIRFAHAYSCRSTHAVCLFLYLTSTILTTLTTLLKCNIQTLMKLSRSK